MSRECPDPRFHPDNLGARIVSRVSRTVHDALLGVGG
jgi:hypothetical protein